MKRNVTRMPPPPEPPKAGHPVDMAAVEALTDRLLQECDDHHLPVVLSAAATMLFRLLTGPVAEASLIHALNTAATIGQQLTNISKAETLVELRKAYLAEAHAQAVTTHQLHNTGRG